MKSRNKTDRFIIMTPPQAASYLGLHLITIYRLAKKRQLPAFKVGSQWRFKKDLLDKWIVSKLTTKEERKPASRG